MLFFFSLGNKAGGCWEPCAEYSRGVTGPQAASAGAEGEEGHPLPTSAIRGFVSRVGTRGDKLHAAAVAAAAQSQAEITESQNSRGWKGPLWVI